MAKQEFIAHLRRGGVLERGGGILGVEHGPEHGLAVPGA